MIKRGLTKCLSLLLALTVIFSNFFSLGAVTAYAAVGEKADIYMVQFPRGNDANRSGWGHGALQYMNGWNTGGASNTMALRAIFFLLLTFYFLLFLAIFSTMCYYVPVRNPLA